MLQIVSCTAALVRGKKTGMVVKTNIFSPIFISLRYNTGTYLVYKNYNKSTIRWTIFYTKKFILGTTKLYKNHTYGII